jgi:5-methyltetrahydropteroyltriglutamate--homocysteine methyltransferase
MKVLATNIGYPYIGEKRDLKFLIEAFWRGEKTTAELNAGASAIMLGNIEKQSGLDIIPVGEFSLYDRMLDLTVLFNLIPARFENLGDEHKLYFNMARGKGAMEMTKWFNTNYHYLVPELSDDMSPKINATSNKYVRLLADVKRGNTKVTLIGPYTYIKLAKGSKDLNKWFNTLSQLYLALIDQLVKAGAEYIQIEEPALVTDFPKSDLKYVKQFLASIKGVKVILATYFDALTYYKETVALPVQAIAIDFVSNTANFANVKKLDFPKDKIMIAGVVNGRNIWATDLKKQIALCQAIIAKIKPDVFMVSPSCSLQHVPVTTKYETNLPKVLADNLAYADEKLKEIMIIKKALNNGEASVAAELKDNAKKLSELCTCGERNLKDVKSKLKKLKASDFKRPMAFAARKKAQVKLLKLPVLPTTTIGSFPQTEEVRMKRASFRKKQISAAEYKEFIRGQIKEVIKLQESIGLDVLVHGEFERTDMVEFFGEKLSGFATSLNGWVVSYGSRCVKPPMIWADVKRLRAMTLDEILFAQTLTSKPVKGMLTGPITIINWSFVREDIPKKDVANQIGLSLADEVLDLEKNGIKMVQIDEAALQEGAPIKQNKKAAYYDFSVKAFRLCSSRVKNTTQIHTHMCYSNFNEIFKAIDGMDADVISIENSRSKGELLDVFKKYKYKKDIGPGVYDIHSPAIPSVDEMVAIIDTSKKFLNVSQLWVNPDCGLKTRGYKETIPALKNMVQAARVARAALKQK